MSDQDRIKRNIKRMIDQNASEDEIDSYIRSEGADINSFKANSPGVTRANAAIAGANKGIAGLVGLPVDTAENVANLGLAAGGALATAVGRPDLAPDLIQNSPLSSKRIESFLNKYGIGTKNPSPADKVSQFLYTSGRIGGGSIGSPASAVIPSAIGGAVAEQVGGPEWIGVGSMMPAAVGKVAGELAQPLVDSAKAKQAANKSRNSVSDETWKMAREEGYVTPPSARGAGFIENRLESVAGKAAINQESALRNQEVTNKIARREAGLGPNDPISETTLKAARDVLSQPYAEVSSVSQRAATALERLKQARADATAYWKFYQRTADPSVKTKAEGFSQKAELYEKLIDREAAKIGKPDLIQRLRDARQAIAKNMDVERALNLGSGDVDAQVIGRMLDSGKKLSGGLETIGRFAQAFKPFARDVASVPAPGVSKSEALSGALLGTVGASSLGPYGVLAGGLPLISSPVRNMLLTDRFQQGANYDIPLMLRGLENAKNSRLSPLFPLSELNNGN